MVVRMVVNDLLIMSQAPSLAGTQNIQPAMLSLDYNPPAVTIKTLSRAPRDRVFNSKV